tara:strand:+ start:179 stop:1114 length:936 start_codon:yes stop_codon:yes gene_type:complete
MDKSYNSFIWYVGVVEDRNDPKQLGRCRVRCLGYHTSSKESLPTNDLPWAYPMMPITSASMNGIGGSPVGPVEGTWVFGFFRDGESAQEPMMMGTLPGIPEFAPNPNEGFNDPNGIYPKAEFIGEADTNRLTRNDMIDQTVVQSKIDDLDEMEVSTGIGDQDTLSEPQTAYSAAYPFNKVMETESGHIVEVDDTEGHERLHVYHKSGTFIEIHPDGSMVRKVVGKSHEIIASDDNLHIKGSLNVTVEGNSNIYTKGDVNMKTDGNVTHDVTNGNYELNVGGDITFNSNGGSSIVKMTPTSIKLNSGTIQLN